MSMTINDARNRLFTLNKQEQGILYWKDCDESKRMEGYFLFTPVTSVAITGFVLLIIAWPFEKYAGLKMSIEMAYVGLPVGCILGEIGYYLKNKHDDNSCKNRLAKIQKEREELYRFLGEGFELNVLR